MKIALLIPAYNEEQNIEAVLQEVERLRELEPRWDVLPIVINDGSVDGTRQVLAGIAPRHRAWAVHLPVNLGIGAAVQTGFKCALHWGADVAVQLDGDGQHPADQISRIVGPVLANEADIVVGSRYVAGAGGNVSSLLRQAGTQFFSALLRLLTGVTIRDTTSGFRAFNSEIIEYFANYYPDDYPEVEACVILARLRFRIREVPVRMRHRAQGTSSITPLRSFYYMLKVAFAAAISRVRVLPRRNGDSLRLASPTVCFMN